MAKLDPRLQDVVRSQIPFARFVVVGMVAMLQEIGGPDLVDKAISDFLSDGPGSSPDMTERVPGTNRTLGDYNGLSAGQMLVIHDNPKTVAKVAAMFAERGMTIGLDDVPPEKRSALGDALADHQQPDAEPGDDDDDDAPPAPNIVRNLRETLSGKAEWRKRGGPASLSGQLGKPIPLDPIGDPNALKSSPGTGQTMTPVPAVVGEQGTATIGDAGAADDDDDDGDDGDDAQADAAPAGADTGPAAVRPEDVLYADRPLKDYAGKSRDQIVAMNVPPRVASRIVAALAKLPPPDAGK